MNPHDWFTDNFGRKEITNVLVAIAVVSLIAISGFDVFKNKHDFKPQELGTGIAAIIAALGVYRWGDSKNGNTPSNS